MCVCVLARQSAGTFAQSGGTMHARGADSMRDARGDRAVCMRALFCSPSGRAACVCDFLDN